MAAAGASARRTARVRARIAESLGQGDTYGALQAALATVARARTQADAVGTAMACGAELAAAGAHKEASELVKTALKGATPMEEEVRESLADAMQTLCEGAGLSSAPPTAGVHLLDAIDCVIEAAAGQRAARSDDDAVPRLHRCGAEVARATGQITAAHEHYIRACCPDRYSGFLVSWSSACKPSERSLLLVRACLQMLAMGDLRDSARCLQALEARGVVPAEGAALAAAKAGAAAAAREGPALDGAAAGSADAGTDSGSQVRCGGIVWGGARLSLLNLLRILHRVCARGRAASDVWAEVRARYSPVLDGEGDAGVDDGEIGRLVDLAAARFLR